MAADTPLTRLALAAASVADDVGYVALNDLALALEDVVEDYRVIGGHMVTMLAARWQLGRELYRETGDETWVFRRSWPKIIMLSIG